MNSLEQYAERLIKERDELNVKVDKLISFLDSDKIHKMSSRDVELLRSQLELMSGYLQILNIRIGRYEEGKV